MKKQTSVKQADQVRSSRNPASAKEGTKNQKSVASNNFKKQK